MQKKIFLALALLLSVAKLYAKEKQSHAQFPSLKIGYTNIEYIMEFLPESKTIASEYTTFEKQLQKQFQNQWEISVKELQQKIQAFQKGHETMPEAVRNKKQQEIQQLQRSIEKQQIEIQEKLDVKHNSLLKPIYEKIMKAIEQVAKEKGYTYVLHSNVGGLYLLLYADEKHNISDDVLKQLGIDPAKATHKIDKRIERLGEQR